MENHLKIFGAKHLYIVFPKISELIKDYDENKYLTLIPGNEEGIDLMKMYLYFWDIIIFFIETNNTNSCDDTDNYLETKINSDHNFPSAKPLEFHRMII